MEQEISVEDNTIIDKIDEQKQILDMQEQSQEVSIDKIENDITTIDESIQQSNDTIRELGLSIGVHIHDIIKIEDYQVLSFDEDEITLKYLPRFRKDERSNSIWGWDELLEKFKSNEIKIDGFEPSDYGSLFYISKILSQQVALQSAKENLEIQIGKEQESLKKIQEQKELIEKYELDALAYFDKMKDVEKNKKELNSEDVDKVCKKYLQKNGVKIKIIK